MRPLKRRSEDVLALAAIAVLIAAAFADVLFFHRALYVRDIARGFYPAFASLRDVLRSGAFPFWNARFNAGQPLAANPMYAALYPPQWLAAISSGVFGYQLEIVLHYLLAAAGMYFFLRSLGLRLGASLFGAVSFALGGMLLSLSNLPNVMFGVAWFPWLGFAMRRRCHSLAALVLGTILIVGDQGTILQAGFLLVIYALWRREWKPFLYVLACGIVVGSAQIIPALDFQRDSGRAGALPYAVATEWMLPPARIFELALPSLFGSFREFTFYWAGKRFYGPLQVPWVLTFYSGLLVFVLACAGMIRRVQGWALTLAAVAISYAIAATPLLYFVGFRSFRYPEKFFISGVFMLIVFASMAADRLPELRRTAAYVSAGVAVAAIGSLLVPFAAIWQLTGYYGDLQQHARTEAIVMAITAAVLALLLGVRRVPLIVLAVFVLADLGPRIRGLTPRIDASYYDPPPIAGGLRGARIYNDADWRLSLLGTPPIPVEQRPWRLRNALIPESQAIWGIESVLESDVTHTNLLPSIEFSQRFWAAQLSGREDQVQKFLAAAGTTYVAALRDATDAADPIRLVRLNHPRFYFPAGGGRVLRASQPPNGVDLDVETGSGAPLAIAITRHKYWSATIDGLPAEIHPAMIAFQMVVVPPGRHHVVLRYRNPLIIAFGFVSLLSVAALLTAHFVAKHRRGRGDVERVDAA